MKLEAKHINLFEKLHKFYITKADSQYFIEKWKVNKKDSLELANSAGAFRFLNDFNTNLDCKSIGFDGKQEMRKYFHQWLQIKDWKGVGNISNINVLLRKFRNFNKISDTDKQLNTLVNKNIGNKNSLKFNNDHIQSFEESFVSNDFNKTFDKYLLNCIIKQLYPVSKATAHNYYNKVEKNITKSLNVSSIEYLHSQFISLSDFEIFHLKFGYDENTASKMVNSVACLTMLNYPNLKAEIKQFGFKTKGQFVKFLLDWIKEKNWQGLNKISNTLVLQRKAREFQNALDKGREEGLKVFSNKKTGNRNAFKFHENHKNIVRELVRTRIYKSKIQCFKDYQKECQSKNIEPVGEGTISQFIIDEKLFEQLQKKARQYSAPIQLIFTDEQNAILNYDNNLKINAVAGSGKTTTFIEYAKTRDENSKILYLAFNKSVKIEAVNKFKNKGLKNVDITTAHSIAYRYIVKSDNKYLLTSDLSPVEILNSLEIEFDRIDKADKIILATHIKRFYEYYCNSTARNFDELNYLDIVLDEEARIYVADKLNFISKYSILLFNKMERGQIRFTHDYYLKKFQLVCPNLEYDYIFFDEGQDASPAMLDVFIKQQSKKILVGDSNQQIYSWRYAINSLERIDFKEFNLSNSFRFGREIANLALNSIELKKHIGTYKPIVINGLGSSQFLHTKATLARTNLKLLEMAITDVFDNKTVKSIYFEGHISTYKFGEKNSIMYDILSLYYNKKNRIKNHLIKEFANFRELINYTKKTEDAQLSMLINLVLRFKGKLPSLIAGLKAIHLTNSVKDQADMTYSTVNKCKGMEYDEVTIADDFYSEKSIIEKYQENSSQYNINKLNEEINLLYVAITRAKNRINIPKELILNKSSIGIIQHK